MPLPDLGPIVQIGYLVDDLADGVDHWIKTMGVGPWTIYRNVTMTGQCRGTPTTVLFDVALSYQGDLQIELIEPKSRTPSPYQDRDGRTLTGIHHIAWLTDDLAGVVGRAKSRGLTPAFEATNAAVTVAYLEQRSQPGILFEFIQGAGQREMIAAGIQAARTWDGANPITTIDFAALSP